MGEWSGFGVGSAKAYPVAEGLGDVLDMGRHSITHPRAESDCRKDHRRRVKVPGGGQAPLK